MYIHILEMGLVELYIYISSKGNGYNYLMLSGSYFLNHILPIVKVHFGEMSTGVYRNGPCRIIYLYIIQRKWIYMLSGSYFFNHILPLVKVHFGVLFVWSTDIT